MRRFLLLGLGTILLHVLTGSGLAQETPEEPPARPEAADVPPRPQPELTAEEAAIARAKKAILRDLRARQRIDEALDEDAKIAAFDSPLVEVLGDVGNEHDLTFVLDPEGLEQAGVASDQRMTLNLRGISLRSALRILLQPLHLTFTVRNEVLVITSLDCPERLATIRTFPVAELLQRMEDPGELITALELVLPDNARIDPEMQCKPRFRLIAGHLVIRGSPRHHDLAEQFLEGILLGRSSAEGTKPVVKVIELSPAKP